MRRAAVAGVVGLMVLPVSAVNGAEPFGQERVDIRPPREPQPASASTPRHSHGTGHSHAHHPHSPRGHGHHHSKEQQRGLPHRHREAHSHPNRLHDHARHGAHDHSEGVETEHLFGFTRGSDIDPPGHRHLISDLTMNFGRSSGRYASAEQHLEYAFTPWSGFHVGLGASFANHRTNGVEGLDDRRQTQFEGVSIELRQRLLDRSQAPFGLTLTAEPHGARLDEESGAPARKAAVEFNLAADRELIANRLYAAFNLIYEPEWVRDRQTGLTDRGSTVGASVAAMLRLADPLFVGGEVRYLRRYEGAAANVLLGEAVFAGPIVTVNFSNSLALIAAYSAQVSGRPVGTSNALDLDNFNRHNAKLKLVYSF